MFKKSFYSLILMAGASALFALPPHLGSTEYKASSINNLDFNLSWEDLQLEATGANEIVVDIYCNNKKYAPKVKTSSGTLIIESVPSTSVVIGVQKKCTVIVKLPQDKDFDKVKIQTSSGDINSSVGFSARDSISIGASSGDIKIEKQISATKDAVIKTSSGSSYLEGISAKQLTASASSGNITVNRADSKTAVIHTSSGNIKLKNFQAVTFEGSASSGNITGQNLDCQSFNVSTSSGTIGLEFSDAPAAKSSVTSSSGTQYISMPRGSRINVHVTTSSGGFTNAFTSEKLSSHADYNNAINGGGAKVSLTSTSGNITLDVGDGVASKRTAIEASDSDEIPVVIFDDVK